MASSNPFRKRTATEPTTTPPATVRFPALESIETAPTPPPPTSFQQADTSTADSKSKTTKKVRVLSPPPLSPDSPRWLASTPSFAEHAAGQQQEIDPFDAISADDSDREIVSATAHNQPRVGTQVSGNPFSKTLRDVESPEAEEKLEMERKEEGNALKAANTARKSLDVSSFKRLLMTGTSGSDKPSTPSRNRQSMPPPARTINDSSSVSLASTQDSSKGALTPGSEQQEVSLMTQEASDTPEDDLGPGDLSDSSTSIHMGKGKKPPPPPSSRHGKSIKLDLVGGQAPEALATMSPSDMNKPLPPAPARMSFEDGSESPFDREAAGKIPEVEASMDSEPPNPPGSSRKAVPAPPPRRGHARGESKVNATGNSGLGQQGLRLHDDENLSRSSSLRSRPEHTRHDSHGPAPPPPPRRSHQNSRQSSQIPPSVAASFGSNLSQSPAASSGLDVSRISTPTPHAPSLEQTAHRDAQPGGHQPGPAKTWAPPPPPARNTSVRRPASLRSVESASRRVSFEAKPHSGSAPPPPPPPPRRQRGSSRGSIDGPPGRTSIDGVAGAESSPLTEEECDDKATTVTGGPASPRSAKDAGKSTNILADLDALQREVDALRGKMG
ncbi:hypothetical protein FZEAL_8798 [Fusarium zealandicum]|uniref:Uncharacterized protein n=1 Tax=Fusarium zealandicum TaxID=1053134 RepID=A0A8H4XHH3_9HYPO|nr:hypothetical protein FZEAL_8798 [Fusarium zealandicum]